MGWIDDLAGRVVALDTAPLIYFMEQNAVYYPKVKPFFEALAAGRFEAATSVITLAEVLVLPWTLGNDALGSQYKAVLLGSAHLHTYLVSADIAELAAAYRARTRLRTPDAIQAATAHLAGARYFVTNDVDLTRIARLSGLGDFEVLLLDAV